MQARLSQWRFRGAEEKTGRLTQRARRTAQSERRRRAKDRLRSFARKLGGSASTPITVEISRGRRENRKINAEDAEKSGELTETPSRDLALGESELFGDAEPLLVAADPNIGEAFIAVGDLAIFVFQGDVVEACSYHAVILDRMRHQ